MNNIIIRVLFFLCIFFVSCQNEEEISAFIDNNGNASFSEFVDKSLLIRGTDSEGNLVIFFNVGVSNLKDGPYILTVDKATEEILHVDSKLRNDSINFDTTKIKTIASKFLSYNVALLRADLDSNVYVGFKNIEQPELLRYFKKDTLSIKGWKRITGNWFKRK